MFKILKGHGQKRLLTSSNRVDYIVVTRSRKICISHRSELWSNYNSNSNHFSCVGEKEKKKREEVNGIILINSRKEIEQL